MLTVASCLGGGDIAFIGSPLWLVLVPGTRPVNRTEEDEPGTRPEFAFADDEPGTRPALICTDCVDMVGVGWSERNVASCEDIIIAASWAA